MNRGWRLIRAQVVTWATILLILGAAGASLALAGVALLAALEVLKTRVRAQPTDASARLELVGFYREMGAPDQAGRWGITLDGVVTDFERDRVARMIAGAMWWGGDASSILALPKGSPPHAVEELLRGPVEEHRQRLRDRHPNLEVTHDENSRVMDAALYSWLGAVMLLLIGLLALWVIAGLDLLDASFVSRARRPPRRDGRSGAGAVRGREGSDLDLADRGGRGGHRGGDHAFGAHTLHIRLRGLSADATRSELREFQLKARWVTSINVRGSRHEVHSHEGARHEVSIT